MNLVELASRIRSARLGKGYTLDRLSELSGLAKGLLSKVENFRVTPSLPTLAKLCEALGIRLSELVDGLDERPRLSIVRRKERRKIERDPEQSDVAYSSLAHRRPNRNMDPLELLVPAHGGRKQALAHEGEEFLLVLSGRVDLEFEGERHAMEAGDSAYFDAESPHRILNPLGEDARVLCVNLSRPV